MRHSRGIVRSCAGGSENGSCSGGRAAHPVSAKRRLPLGASALVREPNVGAVCCVALDGGGGRCGPRRLDSIRDRDQRCHLSCRSPQGVRRLHGGARPVDPHGDRPDVDGADGHDRGLRSERAADGQDRPGPGGALSGVSLRPVDSHRGRRSGERGPSRLERPPPVDDDRPPYVVRVDGGGGRHESPGNGGNIRLHPRPAE